MRFFYQELFHGQFISQDMHIIFVLIDFRLFSLTRHDSQKKFDITNNIHLPTHAATNIYTFTVVSRLSPVFQEYEN